MALQKEMWLADIQKNLYADNSFLTLIGKDDSAYVDNITVHVPQSGNKPSVVKNRGTVPAQVSQRTDSEITYTLSGYSTDPILIKDSDDVKYLSYDKRMDVLGDHIKTLSDTIANHTLYEWSASSASWLVRTTGSTSAGSLPHSTATGTRKLLTLADIASARAILDKQNLGNGKIYMIVPSDMYWNDMIQITQITKYLEFGKAVVPNGVIGNVLGMDIIMRSSVQVYDNAGTPARKALSGNGAVSSPGAADNNSIMVVHENYVRKALGEIKPYSNIDDPVYYGSLFSAEVFHGAKKSRTNEEGIVQIVQAP